MVLKLKTFRPLFLAEETQEVIVQTRKEKKKNIGDRYKYGSGRYININEIINKGTNTNKCFFIVSI